MADKTKTIKNASDTELGSLIVRLRKEIELQRLVGDLRRRSTPTDQFTDPEVSYERPGISTETPIDSLYHKADETLAHFGVPGMRWGIRRGRTGVATSKHVPKKMTGSEDSIKARALRQKGSRNLSNSELRDVTSRMQLEKQLRDLKMSEYTKSVDAARAVLAVGTTAASIYGLSMTPLAQAVKRKLTRS